LIIDVSDTLKPSCMDCIAMGHCKSYFTPANEKFPFHAGKPNISYTKDKNLWDSRTLWVVTVTV